MSINYNTLGKYNVSYLVRYINKTRDLAHNFYSLIKTIAMSQAPHVTTHLERPIKRGWIKKEKEEKKKS